MSFHQCFLAELVRARPLQRRIEVAKQEMVHEVVFPSPRWEAFLPMIAPTVSDLQARGKASSRLRSFWP